MKQFKIKILGTVLTLCAVALSFASAFLFSACGTVYHSKAGTMDDMVGTYQLTTYTQKDDGNEVDRIAQLHVQAYLVVGADGHGYYTYQDDNTDFWYDSVLIQYTHDLDKPELYKAIQFTKGVDDRQTKIDKQKPGNGYEPIMGFNVNTKTFSYFIPDDKPSYSWIYPSYYTNVVYTKISDKTDLSTVANKMNRNLAPLPRYELKNLNGTLIFHAGMPNHDVTPEVTNPEYGKYKYYVVDFDAVNETADLYYELTEGDAGAQVEHAVPIAVNVVSTKDSNDNTLTQLKVKLLGQEYVAAINFGGAPRYLNYEVKAEPDENGTIYHIYGNYFEKYYDNNVSINEIIAAQLEVYNNAQN